MPNEIKVASFPESTPAEAVQEWLTGLGPSHFISWVVFDGKLWVAAKVFNNRKQPRMHRDQDSGEFVVQVES